MTFISCHRIWLWEVLEITVCKNNCEICDVFLWSLRCCFFFLLFFLTFCGKQQEILCLYAPMYPSVAAHTRVQCTHEHTQQDRHTRTHTHTFILLCKFSCSCDSPALKEAARFCHTRHWWDREGWCEKEWDHATPRDNTLYPPPPCPLLTRYSPLGIYFNF